MSSNVLQTARVPGECQFCSISISISIFIVNLNYRAVAMYSKRPEYTGECQSCSISISISIFSIFIVLSFFSFVVLGPK